MCFSSVCVCVCEDAAGIVFSYWGLTVTSLGTLLSATSRLQSNLSEWQKLAALHDSNPHIVQPLAHPQSAPGTPGNSQIPGSPRSSSSLHPAPPAPSHLALAPGNDPAADDTVGEILFQNPSHLIRKACVRRPSTDAGAPDRRSSSGDLEVSAHDVLHLTSSNRQSTSEV